MQGSDRARSCRYLPDCGLWDCGFNFGPCRCRAVQANMGTESSKSERGASEKRPKEAETTSPRLRLRLIGQLAAKTQHPIPTAQTEGSHPAQMTSLWNLRCGGWNTGTSLSSSFHHFGRSSFWGICAHGFCFLLLDLGFGGTAVLGTYFDLI